MENCERCGRFGARANVEDRGPNGLGGRTTFTLYLCRFCEARYNVPYPTFGTPEDDEVKAQHYEKPGRVEFGD